MKEHWETMQSLDGREKVSFSCFWRTWHVEFPHLKIRAASSHSQCSTCLKHKVLVRDLSNHLAARQAQQQLLQHHLMAQYRDRQVYWSLRGASRLRSAQQITVIMDGMDQCKFSFPRSGAMASKELCNLNRPRLQVTGAIVHGYGLYFFVSSFDHCKDSSASCEIFAHLLTRLKQRGLDLSTCHINLQSDNTSREVKNNTLLRFVSACVSHRLIASGCLLQLRTGHSHEDVDQIFGSLALWIVRHARHIENPAQFTDAIYNFCKGAHRKGFLSESAPVMLTGVGGPGAPHHYEFQRRESLGIAEQRQVDAKYREHLVKYIPCLRSYNLGVAADYFQQWADGSLDLAPLLDVSGSLGCSKVPCYGSKNLLRQGESVN
ncbi:unnamed protein product [Durusdinium trenchii]|uniref:DUF7869 domain-containing protein n=1 Tax=Durusdinium trenchii TaxID=1381693 RepID=A0ABP0IC62_9DINO